MTDERLAEDLGEINRLKTVFSAIMFSFVLFISLVGSLVLLLQHIFRWALDDWFTPFFAPFIEMFSYAIFGFCMLLAFAYLLSTLPQRRWRSWIPIFVHFVTLTLLFTVPFTAVTLKLDFHLNKSNREEVVHMVMDGALKPDNTYHTSFIELPVKYKSLSKGGGEVFVEGSGKDMLILFYTFRGVLDHYSGFVYTMDEESMKDNIPGELVQAKTMSDHWYWIQVE